MKVKMQVWVEKNVKNEDICVDLGGYKDMKALQHSSAVQLG